MKQIHPKPTYSKPTKSNDHFDGMKKEFTEQSKLMCLNYIFLLNLWQFCCSPFYNIPHRPKKTYNQLETRSTHEQNSIIIVVYLLSFGVVTFNYDCARVDLNHWLRGDIKKNFANNVLNEILSVKEQEGVFAIRFIHEGIKYIKIDSK